MLLWDQGNDPDSIGELTRGVNLANTEIAPAQVARLERIPELIENDNHAAAGMKTRESEDIGCSLQRPACHWANYLPER
jgi:hypothetical protein